MPSIEEYIKLLKDLKNKNIEKYELELEKIRQELFKNHCSKVSYKKDCEAAYCIDAYTDTCHYLKKMRKLDQEVGIWSR